MGMAFERGTRDSLSLGWGEPSEFAARSCPDLVGLTVHLAPPGPRFEARGYGVESERNGNRKGDVGEHAGHIHALAKVHDPVAKASERRNRLAAEDRQE